jgi:hypothetical protein
MPLASVASAAAPFFDPSGGPAGNVARPGVGPIVEFDDSLEAPEPDDPIFVPDTAGTVATEANAAATAESLFAGGVDAIGGGARIAVADAA